MRLSADLKPGSGPNRLFSYHAKLRIGLRLEALLSVNIGYTRMRYARNYLFAVFSLLLVVIFRVYLLRLIAFAYDSHLFFYILLVPLVSGYFFYVRKERIFAAVTYSFLAGGLLVMAGILVYVAEIKWGPLLGPTDVLTPMVAAFLLIWLGGFVCLYGRPAFRQALFPLGFLFFMVPIPAVLLDHIVVLLQKGSTEAVDGIFTITALPVQRDGFVFTLSNLAIEVAEQCSGIRSSLYLLLTSLVMGQFFLKTTSRKILLVLAVVPITIFKNGLRIVTLALLGNYVHASILSSNLHRKGGIPFMILAVILLSIVVRWLRKSERHAASGDSPVSAIKSLPEGGDASPA